MPYERVWDNEGGSRWVPSSVAQENHAADYMVRESEDEIAKQRSIPMTGWASDKAGQGQPGRFTPRRQ